MGNLDETSWFEMFCSQSVETIYEAGESYSLQGDRLRSVGYIISGEANAVSYSIDGDQTWLGEYHQGQFIGLISLFTHDISNFEIRAQSRLTVRTLSHDKMLALIRRDVNLCEALAADLALRLNASLSDLLNVHTLSIRGRICAELLRLSLPIGVDPDRHIIRPSPVFIELARRLNSTRETVSRTVSELQKKGVISRHPGALIVENADLLEEAIQKL